jgi:hypothetical protein
VGEWVCALHSYGRFAQLLDETERVAYDYSIPLPPLSPTPPPHRAPSRLDATTAPAAHAQKRLEFRVEGFGMSVRGKPVKGKGFRV